MSIIPGSKDLLTLVSYQSLPVNMKYGDFIIAAGSVAMGAAKRLAIMNEGELRKHFPSFIIEPVKNYKDVFDGQVPEKCCDGFTVLPRNVPEAGEKRAPLNEKNSNYFPADGVLGQKGIFTSCLALGEGGVLNGLWYLCEEFGMGMEIDMLKIPIRQETVEICEYFDIDPYYALSDGAYLLTAPDGELAVRLLEEDNVPAADIGRLTDGRGRTIKYPDHIRFLDRPQKDSFFGRY